MNIFDDLSNALASILNTDPTTAGYILGGALTFTCFAAVLILSSILGNSSEGGPILMSLNFGLILSVLFGWFPLWTILLVALLLAVLLIQPFTEG